MNVVLALIALPIAFLAGVPFEAPVLGRVDSGRPAWRAGLRAGDRILSIDGRHALSWEDVITGTAIGSSTRAASRIAVSSSLRLEEVRMSNQASTKSSVAAAVAAPSSHGDRRHAATATPTRRSASAMSKPPQATSQWAER